MPVGPCDGCTQAEGIVSTVSPIMTVLSIAFCSKRATVASAQSSTSQHVSLPRPFIPAIQAKSALRCSARPSGHQRVSSKAPRTRTASQSACLSVHFIFPISFLSRSPPLSVTSWQSRDRHHRADHTPQPTPQQERRRQRLASPEFTHRLPAAHRLIVSHGDRNATALPPHVPPRDGPEVPNLAGGHEHRPGRRRAPGCRRCQHPWSASNVHLSVKC
jgi:hypothetical protein